MQSPPGNPFSVNISSRDFSSPILPNASAVPHTLSWSAFGGPDQASFSLSLPPDRILDLPNLLRCPVTIADALGVPVWWGYVDEVTTQLEGVQIKLSLDSLFNKVCVVYTFVSPDNKVSDQVQTDFAHDLSSQSEFGIKEITLNENDLDETFAENLRDTFLSSHALPQSTLARTAKSSASFIKCHCKGWYHTLDWQTYTNLDYFYANYGPGPGAFAFDNVATRRNPGQRIVPEVDCDVSYAYFYLRKIGSHSRNFYCRIIDPGTGSAIAWSDSHTAAELDENYWSWIKFTFDPPFSLSAGSAYYFCVRCTDGYHSTNYFTMQIDENQMYKNGKGIYYDGSNYVNMPAGTAGTGVPDTYFRVIALLDTGQQLEQIATAGNQFFERITTLTTGVTTSPYRFNPISCKSAIQDLLDLGTSSNRKVLADVSHLRHLTFYQQPDSDPTAIMDSKGAFYSLQAKPIAPYCPPVGQYLYFTGSNRLSLPFDKNRIPSSFVQSAIFDCQTGGIKINS